MVGIGMDIVEIERIARAVERNQRFVEKVFTNAEIDHCMGKRNCYQHLAARFAAKEAVAKAIGRSLPWKDVEVVNGHRGRPEARISGEALRAANGCRVLITMSHSKNYATATAILVKEDENCHG
ncbi:MAG: holo-ACP synthase [Armatimonadetes bacterium]|nr:holo-ACP synthase [Armatimonadota bacterium]